MNKSLKIVILLVIIFILFALGYLRDNTFEAINFQLERLTIRKEYNYPPTKGFEFLDNYTYMQLYYSKWVLTIMVTILYYFATLYCLKLFYRNSYTKWVSIIYVTLFTLSACFFTGGYLLNEYRQGYLFALKFMQMLQSPFILMMLIPVIQIAEKKEK